MEGFVYNYLDFPGLCFNFLNSRRGETKVLSYKLHYFNTLQKPNQTKLHLTFT